MRIILRLSIVCLLLIVCLLGISFTCPAWAEEMGVDIWCLPGLQREIAHQNDFSKKLDHNSEMVRKRNGMRDLVLGQFIEGRISFHDTVKMIEELNSQDDICLQVIRDKFSAANDTELAGQHLIYLLKLQPHEGDSSRLNEAIVNAERQYHQHFCSVPSH